jgi:Spy/CpxP family protein refolding chaperone
MLTKRSMGFVAVALFAGLMALPTMAQPQGGFDPAQFRQQMNDRIKQMLGATDEEYQALQPKIEKLMTLQRDSRGGMGFGRGRGGPGGPPGGDPNAQQSPTQAATKDLQTALDNKDAKPEEIKAKLTALREAREKAKSEMTAAQKDLRELLTQRQEAVMVMMGFLD